MQVISGIYKGKNLKSPQSDKTHPMGSREKLALFNMLLPYLENGTDYDTLTTGADYRIESIAAAQSMSNCPVTVGHRLTVIGTIANRVIQIVITPANEIWFRNTYTNGWRPWEKLALQSAIDTLSDTVTGLSDEVSAMASLLASPLQLIESFAAKYTRIPANAKANAIQP